MRQRDRRLKVFSGRPAKRDVKTFGPNPALTWSNRLDEVRTGAGLATSSFGQVPEAIESTRARARGRRQLTPTASTIEDDIVSGQRRDGCGRGQRPSRSVKLTKTPQPSPGRTVGQSRSAGGERGRACRGQALKDKGNQSRSRAGFLGGSSRMDALSSDPFGRPTRKLQTTLSRG